jgi:ferredoxin
VPRSADEVIGEAAPANPPVAVPPIPTDWAFWRAELDRCVKCYACRQVCPLCYCERCVADKNRPVRIETSPSPRGNLAWHITRAFHLAGRCIGCGECTRACPAGIPLGLLNRALADMPPSGTWSPQDPEDFIR